MSNKLIKRNRNKHPQKAKRLMISGCLAVLVIAFISVWVHIYLTERRFEEKIENMVLGVDYFMEDVPIIAKRVETDGIASIAENYYFYYRHGEVYEYPNRMQVPGNIYSQYEAGDTILAYTTDHHTYSYGKEGILPKTEFTNNEIMKGIGGLLGVGIAALVLFGFILI